MPTQLETAEAQAMQLNPAKCDALMATLDAQGLRAQAPVQSLREVVDFDDLTGLPQWMHESGPISNNFYSK